MRMHGRPFVRLPEWQDRSFMFLQKPWHIFGASHTAVLL